jgi:DNA-directed RNA polymerase specialized sigma24 family protein
MDELPDPLLDELPEPLTADEQKAIRRAFDKLTDSEQRLLRHRFVSGLGNVEIARLDLSGIPEEHVRVYVNRAAAKHDRLDGPPRLRGARPSMVGH